MAEIELKHVSKAWGAALAVDSISFSVKKGHLAVLLGPSGCGKSTTLRLIAGLDETNQGSIMIGGKDISHAPPSQRGISMVFQNYALFPHLSVAENIVFGLKVRHVPRAERDGRLAKTAALLGLSALLDRKPSQLSGGQQQRVALGRAIVAEAPVCLMDEPLSNLDAQLRVEMRREIRELQKRLGITMVYVTHDQVEAMTMADQVVLMRNGKIEQDGPPDELYEKPASIFVARFVGIPPMNVIALSSIMATGNITSLQPPPQHDPARLGVGIRPEMIEIGDDGFAAQIVAAEYLGAETLVEARIGGEPIIIRRHGKIRAVTGEKILLRLPAPAIQWFDLKTEQRLV